ncbi:MAG: T9SS type A sorting domain-containing protein [Chitinophagaceae bacterium]|nr:T9SS type A sorting domain-containing protein [Chitinophagaceae bacterium]
MNVVTPLSNVANPVNTSACLGNTATFTSATVTGGPFVRQWQESVNSGLTWSNIAGATGATLTLTNVTQIMNNNLYRVNYTAAPCAGTISSASAKLTVNPLPVVTISAPDLALTPGSTTVITGSSSPAAISWSWTRDGAPIAGTTNTQTVNINTLGAYQATAVDNQTPGCTAKSNILVIGSESSDRLWIYPNPTTGAFQARLYFQSDFSEKRIVTIYNSAGQEITSQRYNLLNITAPYLQMDFDLSKLARGTYVVKVVHEFTGKIVSGLVLVQ